MQDVKKRLLDLARASKDDYAAVLMQGCGSMGVEAVIGCAVPRENGKLLVAVNGAYGRRIADMARVLHIPMECVEYPEDKAVDPADIDRTLAADKAITHVVVVHCETTSGIFNPIKEVGKVVEKRKRAYIVDAMSSFGASDIKMEKWHIDWLISSANKCIEGVPGFSFVIVRNKALAASEGNARSLCLDLHAQHEDMRKNGQFRYTPPTHAILAFHQALLELEAEGGVEARMKRYQNNCHALRRGMADLGFREFLAPDDHGWIITSFRYPPHSKFDFNTFYDLLCHDGFVIYPGKVGNADLFRVGTVGHIERHDIENLVAAMGRVLAKMGVAMTPESE